MSEPVPIVLVPGLGCSARLFAAQIPALWPFGPVTVADHRRDDTMAAIAARILAAAPPRFALAGLSMGGYVAFEMLRQAAERVVRLALLDTGAGVDDAARKVVRDAQIAGARAGRLAEITETLYPRYVHPHRHADAALKRIVHAMAQETGAAAFARQQTAIKGRADAHPLLEDIRCPTLVLVGDSDAATPPELSHAMAQRIPGATLVVVPECGHLATLEQPDAVNAALVAWMAR
ncbi:MAG: alpha/beta fold hydrolase [Acidobacteria bacterium]|nr:alpha/beta fold hydrolase [Acidobacteriota bacterium]